MNKTLNLFENFKVNLNEQEKEELEDAKETLNNPNLKGDERTEYQHDVSRLENKPNLTENEDLYSFIDELDFSINTGVFDGDIPEVEKEFNIKIKNVTEPNAKHNAVYKMIGTKENLTKFIKSVYDDADSEEIELEKVTESTNLDENYNDNTINDLQAVLDRWLNSITEVKENLKNITEPDKVKEAKAWLNMATKEFDKVNEELNKLILKK